jgi:hypothetical protein
VPRGKSCLRFFAIKGQAFELAFQASARVARAQDGSGIWLCIYHGMIRKLKSGQYRLYLRKKDASTGKRRNLGTFSTLDQAKQHEREVQYFKRH